MWIFAGGVLLFIGLMGISSPAYWAFLAANCALRARIVIMAILTHEPPFLERKAHSLAVGVCSSVAGACGGIIVIPTDRDTGFYIIPLARGIYQVSADNDYSTDEKHRIS